MLKFRFMDMALWRMENVPNSCGGAVSADRLIRRAVWRSIRRAIGSRRLEEGCDELIRDYLHMVMHCIFRHPFDKDHRNRQAWNLTCDIIAESVALDMCAGRFSSPQDAERTEVLDRIKMLTGSLLPNKVYALVKGMVLTPSGQQYLGMGRSTLNDWVALFKRRNHSAWPSNADEDSPAERREAQKPEEVSERDSGEAPSPMTWSLNLLVVPMSKPTRTIKGMMRKPSRRKIRRTIPTMPRMEKATALSPFR